MRKAVELSLGIILIVLFYSIIFMVLMRNEGQEQNLNPIAALYWVLITITTLGYGDIVFRSQIGRLFSILVALSGIVILWAMILPLVVAPRLRSLVETIPTSVPAKIKDHIIISGYNYMLEPLSERLSLRKIPFLIIERSEEIARSIYRRYPTLWGDPSDHEVLKKANISSARLFITNETDELDAEVILSLRFISDIKIIELVTDLNSVKFLCYAGASRTISPKTLVGTRIAQIALPPKKNELPEAIPLFGKLMLVSFPIYPGSELIKQSMTINDIKKPGLNIIGIWQKGVLLPDPGPEVTVQSNSVFVAVSDLGQLSRLRDLTSVVRKEWPLIILGYGDVGRTVAKVLHNSGIEPVIVDRRNLGEISFVNVTGEATSEAVLIEAGIKNAAGVLILLNNDSEVIYCTLLAKNLNPNAFVIARANRIGAAENIYKAGADHVASVPLIASHMLAKIIQDEKEELALLYEDLELKLFHMSKKSRLVGKTIGELNLMPKFGCRIVAMEIEGQAIADIDQNLVLQEGNILALIGNPDGIDEFNQTYDRKPALRRMLRIPK
jgi:voltage-gated potassium channel